MSYRWLLDRVAGGIRSDWVIGLFLLIVSWSSLPGVCQEGHQSIGVQLAEGMGIKKVASDGMATNIFCMTIDSRGQTVVAGPGYIKKLIDNDADGVFDNVILFSKLPSSGAQGMYFEGPNLICTGDGALLRFVDKNHDDIADGPPERLLPLKTGGEHLAHAVRRGPDGWLYVLCGNMVTLLPEYFSGPNSPVKRPESGFLMRISPDFGTREIVSHGFRNAYDFDFNSAGDIFVYDSDGERDISLPWYRPTRVFQVRPGDHAGWISAGWKRPGYFFDMPQVMGALGRGSPTGVCCYQHDGLGTEYTNAIFVADWTFGRIVVFKQGVDGNYDRGSVFAHSQGQFGFAITDLEVATDGSLLVSVGGRGTAGGVYRIFNEHASTVTDRVFDRGLPLSSWGRAHWPTDQLRWKRLEALGDGKTDIEKILLVQRITNVDGGAPVSVLRQSLEHGDDDALSAAVIRSVSRSPWSPVEIEQISKALVGSGKKTRIAALESLVGRRDFIDQLDFESQQCLLSAIRDNLVQPDATTRRLIFNTIRAWPDDLAEQFPLGGLGGTSRVLVRLGQARDIQARIGVFHSCMALLADAKEDRGLVIRLAQLAMDGCGPTPGMATVFDGYSPRIELPIDERDLPVIKSSPEQTIENVAELQRLSAMFTHRGRTMFADTGTTENEETTEEYADLGVEEDISWLIQVARTGLSVPSNEAANRFLGLADKVIRAGLEIDRNWYPRLGEIAKRIFENQPSVARAILRHRKFGNSPYTYLHAAMPGPLKRESAAIFESTIRRESKSASVGQLRIAASVEVLDADLFRRCAGQPHLRDEATVALAEHPMVEDRQLFIEGMDSLSPETVKRSVVALRRLREEEIFPSGRAELLSKCLETANRLGWDKQSVSIRDQIMMLIRAETGRSFGYKLKAADNIQNEALTKWRDYLSSVYPGRFNSSPEFLDFETKLARIRWMQGDSIRGLALYRKQQCALCHDGGTALGPKLGGITSRFSNRDLFRSIAMPSEQVPSRYRAMIIETVDGLIVTGAVIYESADGITLVESTGRTVRVNKSDIESKAMSSRSLMPDGLLDRVDERGWADLWAYLKTL